MTDKALRLKPEQWDLLEEVLTGVLSEAGSKAGCLPPSLRGAIERHVNALTAIHLDLRKQVFGDRRCADCGALYLAKDGQYYIQCGCQDV